MGYQRKWVVRLNNDLPVEILSLTMMVYNNTLLSPLAKYGSVPCLGYASGLMESLYCYGVFFAELCNEP